MSTVVLVFLAAGVYVLAGWWVAGRFGDEALEPTAQPDATAALEGVEVDGVNNAPTFARTEFDTAVRGYRMDEVDVAITALQEQIRQQADEIARLRAGTNPASQDTVVANPAVGSDSAQGAAIDSAVTPEQPA